MQASKRTPNNGNHNSHLWYFSALGSSPKTSVLCFLQTWLIFFISFHFSSVKVQTCTHQTVLPLKPIITLISHFFQCLYWQITLQCNFHIAVLKTHRWLCRSFSVTEAVLFNFCDLFIIPIHPVTHPVTHHSTNHHQPISICLECASDYFLSPTCFHCKYFLHIYSSTKQFARHLIQSFVYLLCPMLLWKGLSVLVILNFIYMSLDVYLYSSFQRDYYMKWIFSSVYTVLSRAKDRSRHTTQPWHLASSTAMFNNSSSVCRLISHGLTSSSCSLWNRYKYGLSLIHCCPTNNSF